MNNVGSPPRGFDPLDIKAGLNVGRKPRPTPPAPPPPAGAGLLCLVPNGGFPGSYGNMAASLNPKFIREDHLSSALIT